MSELLETETNAVAIEVAKEDEEEAPDNVESDLQELEQINSYINELNTRFEQKRVERDMHNVKNIQYPDESFFANLDSSIKKNTAFVKKLRNMTEAQKDVIMKDLSSLNLSRYISELASALVETKIKLNEISMCVKICSFLHLRYQDFANQLLDAWIKNLPRKSTDTFNASKMRIDIRLYTELILCGIFQTKDSLPTLGNLLTLLTIGDKENNNLNIILGFCRQYTNEFAGLAPRKMRQLAEKHNLTIPVSNFLSLERQRGVRNLFKDYFKSLITHVLKDYKHLQYLESDMKRILMTRGEVSKNQKVLFEAKNIEFQKLWVSTQQFADLIDEDLPELSFNSQSTDGDNDTSNNVIFDFSNRFRNEQSATGQLWEDEETRTFYENLPDLKSLIPAILYKDSLKDAPVNANETNSNDDCSTEQNVSDCNVGDDGKTTLPDNTLANDLKKPSEEIEIDDEDFADSGKDVANLNENDELEIALSMQKVEIDKTEDNKDDKENDDNKTNDGKNSQSSQLNKASSSSFSATKGQLDIFFASLLKCVNRDFIDKAALTFATTFNTKNNRKKLISALFTAPRTRLDLLPFYARFVAQLAPIMPNVSSDLVSLLKHNFRYLFKKKDQINIESKVKNVRFIGELVKFGLFPKTDALYILKTLLSDFRYHHIEMTCNLFETCGQYLYRSPDSFHMCKHLLEQMMRHNSRMAFDSRYATMIENVYYMVNPPEDKLLSRNTPSKPVMHLYIEHLIYEELSKSTITKVLGKFRKLNWKDPEISTFAIKCLSSVWNLKYYNIIYLTHFLVNFYSYQEWVIPRVLDHVFEDIRIGMQMNSIEFNQRRMSVIKFFAECFNYRLIDSTLMFRVLYSLIIYGVNYSDITQSPLDPPSNLMRLRLVACVLHTCGRYLASGIAKKKLDYFIYFYQRYYWLKKSYLNSLSHELRDSNALFYIDTIFKDVMQYLKPKFRIADSYATACKHLENHLKDVTDKAKEILPNSKISIDQILNPNMNKPAVTVSGLDAIVEEESMDEDQEVDLIDSGGDRIPDENESNEGDEEADYSDIGEIDPIDDDDIAGESDEEETGGGTINERMNAPITVNCMEDDEFQRDFEQMLSDNLISRTQEVVRSNVEIVIPIERDTEKKKCTFLDDDVAKNSNSFSMSIKNSNQNQEPQETFNFRVMTRNVKSNRPLLKSIEVNHGSELVQNYLAQQKALHKEKQEFKMIILDINQRNELQDKGGSNANASNTSNSATKANSEQYQQAGSGYHRPGGSGGYGPNYQNNYYRRRHN